MGRWLSVALRADFDGAELVVGTNVGTSHGHLPRIAGGKTLCIALTAAVKGFAQPVENVVRDLDGDAHVARGILPPSAPIPNEVCTRGARGARGARVVFCGAHGSGILRTRERQVQQ